MNTRHVFPLFLFLFLVPAVGWAAKPTVLIIESYHQGYAWDRDYVQGIHEILAKQCQLSRFEMDTKRLPKARHPAQADLAWAQYQALQPTLVILGDDNAIQYLGPRFAQTDTPVVYLGLNRNPNAYQIHHARNITGVLERPLFKRSVTLIRHVLRPAPKKILILFDSGTTSQAAKTETFGGRARITVSGSLVEVKLIGDWATWRKTVTEAKQNGYDAMIIGLYHTLVDASGHHVAADEVMAWTSRHATVPPFGFWDFAVGRDKTIGGLVLDGRSEGRRAGELAKQILAGKPPAEISQRVTGYGSLTFSHAQLAKHRIDLPSKLAAITRFVE